MTRRLAGAPISWGVCEVPGWGHQLDVDRVLAEMAALGLTASEFGPDGFLPADGAARRETLRRHGLRAVGGFLPVVLHEATQDLVPEVTAALRQFRAADAGVLVLAAATGLDGYDSRPELDADGWRTLLSNLDLLDRVAADAGVTATLHPHVGTMIEGPEEIERLLDGSNIGLCLDTGHVLAGGGDPVRLAGQAAARVRHVHLKDVDAAQAQRVRAGAVSYRDAVAQGLYRPLGQGDVDIAAIVASLEEAGYAGWYVLEQDLVLDREPPAGAGPVTEVAACLAYLRGLPS
ncbi:TIM barrel protein [Micromonospora rubida]|uniref:TIM barrel protein n=1 Tax=Micromonospora rubida TaxID=2697657 RepID=UPI001377FF92|nr:TIM barrel protein [Micromonospora rubida]NBE83320.1 TIM barrel protein [Micromonospora rubida]